MLKKSLTNLQIKDLLGVLNLRFHKHKHRHSELDWGKIEKLLLTKPEKLWSLNEMERTGGEPDVVLFKKTDKEIIFCDCSTESPKERRSLCYDANALAARKEHKPKNSALGMADEMGVMLLNEEQYYELQTIENFDTKTSSWLLTPNSIRKSGGAIFGDFRFGRVFTYHNGAESYYAGRAFRSLLKV
ncbi:MAG: DUF4256 domain-containing protein [Bacteroidetes bacterium]|nr:DUF4256 domain-containing protein [Bacteroidota bacterium]